MSSILESLTNPIEHGTAAHRRVLRFDRPTFIGCHRAIIARVGVRPQNKTAASTELSREHQLQGGDEHSQPHIKSSS